MKDAPLAQVLEKLSEASLIGLDFYRDEPSNIDEKLRNNNRLISICDLPNANNKFTTASLGSPIVPKERVGFADIPEDSDNVVRRQQLLITSPEPDKRCSVDQSFSLLIAKRYLQMKYPEIQYVEHDFSTNSGEFRIGNVPFKRIESSLFHKGVYRWLPKTRDYYTLLNYRFTNTQYSLSGEVIQFSPSRVINLYSFLKGDVVEVKDRIVLIGTVTVGDGIDDWETPYGKMAGITLHAHMISQILSAVVGDEDGKPRQLLQVFPVFWEFPLILFWSLLGSLLILCLHLFNLRFPLCWAISLTLLGLVPLIISYVFLVQWSYWLPSVPMMAAYYLSSIGTSIFGRSRNI